VFWNNRYKCVQWELYDIFIIKAYLVNWPYNILCKTVDNWPFC